MICVTRPKPVHPFGLRLAALLNGLAPRALLPPHDRPQLHVLSAIHMTTSFQVVRTTRLILAHQRTQRTQTSLFSRVPRIWCRFSFKKDKVSGAPENLPDRTVNGVRYQIHRYRPRIEGLFARIERWTNPLDPTDVFWRSISKENITTWYGKTPESRICDPDTPGRIFSWLICQSHDDKGNVIVYGYKNEDAARIFEDTHGDPLVKAHERNRTTDSRQAQRYLKRIRYGHHTPYFPVLKEDESWPEPQDAAAPDGSNAWRFEVVFDYGEHDTNAPTPGETGEWPARRDPFSSYRAGFEVRTYRTCQRVLMFHLFPGEPGVGRNCLVRSTDFTYSDEVNPADVRNPVYTFLHAVTQTGYRRNNGGYVPRSLPPVEFGYTEPTIQNTVEQVEASSLENLPHRTGRQRLPLDRPAWRGHPRYPHRTGRHLVLQTQSQPNPG